MNIEKNKLTRAEFLIYRYVDSCLVPIKALYDQDVDEAMNLPHHNLSKDELNLILFKLFESGNLVAKFESRGYFTPTYEEIISSINEPCIEDDHYDYRSVTYYGYTSAAIERYQELKAAYKNEC
jgi:hypothetical protein